MSEGEVQVDAEVQQSHLVLLSELQFAFSVNGADSVKQQISALIVQHKMAPYYQSVCDTFHWSIDAALLASLTADNESALKAAEAKISDAEKNHGEMEVRDALMAKAEHFASIGDAPKALTAYDVALGKTVGAGPKIDVMFAVLRVLLFANDIKMYGKKLDELQKLIDEGGDWDRRNRLKMYRALYSMQTRDFQAASALLSDGLATFGATELFSYSRLVLYVVVCALLSMDRPTLVSKVVRSPEVIGTIAEIPHLAPLLKSIADCQYAAFFPSLNALFDTTGCLDRYLAKHAVYLQRELRLVAYKQFLVSYKAVTLASMSTAFGVSSALLVSDLAHFICANRLACKIDQVAGVVEATRTETRNSQYAAVIKTGDALLNRVQKLSRVISY